MGMCMRLDLFHFVQEHHELLLATLPAVESALEVGKKLSLFLFHYFYLLSLF